MGKDDNRVGWLKWWLAWMFLIGLGLGIYLVAKLTRWILGLETDVSSLTVAAWTFIFLWCTHRGQETEHD